MAVLGNPSLGMIGDKHLGDDPGLAGDPDEADERPSRSHDKRAAEALQALGESLLALDDARLAGLDLPDRLREALRLGRSITSRSASRRQRQYIGKLMRGVDPEPIRAFLARLEGSDEASRARLHRAERWRDRLIDEGDAALGALLEEFPDADRAHLRTLSRQARDERTRGAPPRAGRELFRALKALLDGPASQGLVG
jgi:ribosome-associated protein